jgi:hypothetical protein
MKTTQHIAYVLKCPQEVYHHSCGDTLEELCGLIMPIDYCITCCKFFKGMNNHTITCCYDETLDYHENIKMNEGNKQ